MSSAALAGHLGPPLCEKTLGDASPQVDGRLDGHGGERPTTRRGRLSALVVAALSASLLAGLGGAEAGDVCGTATQISGNTHGNAVHPELVVDAGGNATVVWFQIDGTQYNIASNRYVAGEGWEGAVLLESNGGDAFWPALAVDASGVVTAVWYQGGGSVYDIWSNRFVPGEGWQGAELVEDWDQGTAWDPDLAVAPDGRVAAVWKADNGSRTAIWAASYAPGSGWGGAAAVDEGAAGTPSDLHGGFESGTPFALWRVVNETGTSLWLNRLVPENGGATTTRTDYGTWARLLAHPWLGTPGEEPAVWTDRTWDDYSHVFANLCGPARPASDPTIIIDALPASIFAGVLDAHGTAFDEAGVAAVEVRVDGGSWVAADGTTTWTLRITVGAGAHTLEARATAVKGRTAGASVAFKVEGILAGPGPPPPSHNEPPVEPRPAAPPVVPPSTPTSPEPRPATAEVVVEDGGAPFWLSLVFVAGATALCGVVVWRGRRESSD